MFNDWFTNDFIPNVRNYPKENDIMDKVSLIMDNARQDETLNNVGDDIKVTFLPSNVTVFLHPIDDGSLGNLN